MAGVLINPSATQLGIANAVLSGRGSRYESSFAGPLSIKGVIAGSATWETSAGRYEVVPGSVLLIHEDEEYTVTIDALRPVETFCFFFAHRYLTRLRLARARSLLRSSERSVADVALACGFESLGSFTTLFTRTIGITPARFRRIGEAP